jgi:hypothetical protein
MPQPADSIQKLRRLARDVRARHPAGGGLWWLSYGVAMRVLIAFLGIEWAERHVMGSSSPTDFFKNDWSNETRRNMHLMRVVHLADMLLNLQYAPNFTSVLGQLKRGDIEPTYAELEAAKLLYWSGVPFRFVHPSGHGRTHDLELSWAGHNVCADTKCRIETSERSYKTTLDRLSSNINQLPPSTPGMFFVRLPQSWNADGRDISHMSEMQSLADAFFRGTRRVVALVFFFSLAVEFEQFTAPVILMRTFVNPNHRHDTSVDWNIFSNFPEIQPASWIDVFRICAAEEAERTRIDP